MDDRLRERLAALKQHPDEDAALLRITSGARHRRVRRRALAGTAVAAVVVVLAGAVAFGRGTDQPSELRTVGPPASAPVAPSEPPGTSRALDPLGTAVPDPGSTEPAPPSTAATTSAPAATTSVVPTTTIVNRVTTTTTAVPDPVYAAKGDFVVTVHPEQSDITAGDQVWFDVAVTNRGPAPISYVGNTCLNSIVKVTASAPTFGRNWESDQIIPWNRDATMLAELFAHAPNETAPTSWLTESPLQAAQPQMCLLPLYYNKIDPGATVTGRVVWQSAFTPDALADHTVTFAGVFDDVTDRPGTASVRVHAPAGVAQPIETILRNAAEDERTAAAMIDCGASAFELSYLYQEGHWVVVVWGGSPVVQTCRILVTVDAATAAVIDVQRGVN